MTVITFLKLRIENGRNLDSFGAVISPILTAPKLMIAHLKALAPRIPKMASDVSCDVGERRESNKRARAEPIKLRDLCTESKSTCGRMVQFF